MTECDLPTVLEYLLWISAITSGMLTPRSPDQAEFDSDVAVFW